MRFTFIVALACSLPVACPGGRREEDVLADLRSSGRVKAHRTPAACILVALSLLTFGCRSLEKQIYEQRLAMARAKRIGVEQTLQFVRDHPNPEASSSVHAFVANETINRALSFVDGSTAVYDKKYLIRLEKVRLMSSVGFPVVAVSASASRWSFTARLSVSATALLTIDEHNPKVGTLSIHVTDVVPEVRWYDLHLQIAGFARDLVQSQLQKELDAALPPFDVPLLVGDDLHIKPGVTPIRIKPDADFWEGWIDAQIAYPPVDVGADVKVDRILFLEDGIHCFLTFKKREAAQ